MLLRMLVRPYGAQISDCISAAFGDIRPAHDRAPSRRTLWRHVHLETGPGYVLPVPQRDLFADFARMRREMDQMLGDSWGRTRYVARRSTGFSPNVDVYYCGDPQRAVVKVDLAGVELSAVGIEVSGRHLAIAGERPVQETEGRVYQQVEIPSGPFRRVVELQVEVDAERASATYEDGVLRIDLPLRDPSETTRTVPIGRK
jgi:HSP20 family protein